MARFKIYRSIFIWFPNCYIPYQILWNPKDVWQGLNLSPHQRTLISSIKYKFTFKSWIFKILLFSEAVMSARSSNANVLQDLQQKLEKVNSTIATLETHAQKLELENNHLQSVLITIIYICIEHYNSYYCNYFKFLH